MKRNHRRHQQHRPRIRRRSRPGSVPGTVVAAHDARQTVIRVIAYGPEGYFEDEVGEVKAIRPYLERYSTCWINVDGLANTQVIRELGELFGLHALALEDVVNVHQRAKVEPYTAHLFIVARMVSLQTAMHSEQLSMFVGNKYVLTFQEAHGDCFDPVRERLRKNNGRIRQSGSDYLM
ncbi:MAG: hypothetical protein KDA92_13225, partial [Planctomycetales bacterium]|nr:hypothetical protein [Planctomycetales bacterium]